VATLRIEKLQRVHNLDKFDCGREALNRFLMRYALRNQQVGDFVGEDEEFVDGDPAAKALLAAFHTALAPPSPHVVRIDAQRGGDFPP